MMAWLRSRISTLASTTPGADRQRSTSRAVSSTTIGSNCLTRSSVSVGSCRPRSRRQSAPSCETRPSAETANIASNHLGCGSSRTRPPSRRQRRAGSRGRPRSVGRGNRRHHRTPRTRRAACRAGRAGTGRACRARSDHAARRLRELPRLCRGGQARAARPSSACRNAVRAPGTCRSRPGLRGRARAGSAGRSPRSRGEPRSARSGSRDIPAARA